MRKLLLLAGLAGVGAVIAKKLRSQQAQPVWHTPDTDADPSPERPGGAGMSVVPEPVDQPDPLDTVKSAEPARDVGGASPDEELADSVEEPHRVTTPDEPLDETKVDPKP